MVKKIPCVLIMNKTDLFKEEIMTKPLGDHFPDYLDYIKQNYKEPPATVEDHYKIGIEFMKYRCTRYFEGGNLYAIESCAIDKEECDKVFKIIRREMIEKAMCVAGFNQFF